MDSLSIDDHTAGAGKIGSWSAAYVPSGIPVGRAVSRSDGKFAQGDNKISVAWLSKKRNGTVTIDDEMVSNNLILYVASNQAILLNAQGYWLSTFPLVKPPS